MLPSSELTEVTIETLPSKDYKLNLTNGNVGGYCDNIEAMKQVIFCILSTERYQSLIYSWDYGVETLDLYGAPVGYVVPEIERRIKEALTQDDRINSVENFNFDTTIKGKIHITFTVRTIFGDVESEKAVNI